MAEHLLTKKIVWIIIHWVCTAVYAHVVHAAHASAYASRMMGVDFSCLAWISALCRVSSIPSGILGE